MLERLKTFLKSANPLTGEGQAQREATLDLVLWTMYADNKIDLTENEQLEDWETTTDWDSITPVQLYVNTTLAKVRAAREDQQRANELLQDIYVRLADESHRQQAYEAARRFAEADGNMADAERLFLERVRGMFNLES